MTAVEDAIAAIKLRKEGASFLYRKVADQFAVNRTTLLCRNQGKTSSNAGEAQQRAHLSPQQEHELVKYLQGLTELGLPPTQTMIKQIASEVAKTQVAERWVTRFLDCNSTHLISKWTTRIDRNCHKAVSKAIYCEYFEYIHEKMQEYNVEAKNVYKMDEKGFLLSTTVRSNCVFSKRL
jgi:hypothetical protein